MGQLGFFDEDKRLAAIYEKGDKLEMIDSVVWLESLSREIEEVVLKKAEDKKSSAGSKRIKVIVMSGCWCCNSSTTFKTSRWSMKRETACSLSGF